MQGMSWYNGACPQRCAPPKVFLSRPPSVVMPERGHHPRYVGGFSEGDHLFPFRTEQLSPSAPMVLALKAGRVGRCQPFFSFLNSPTEHPCRAFLVYSLS